MNQARGKPVIQGLGEIALRVRDLDAMQRFYEEVVGLTLMRRFDQIAFFNIAPGVAGHTQIIALFDRSGSDNYSPPVSRATSVDHLAFGIALEDYEAELQRLRTLESEGRIQVRTAEHGWVQWRSIYVNDPEGNTVEWVCFDASIEQAS